MPLKEYKETEYEAKVREYVEQEFIFTVKELESFYGYDKKDGWPEHERLRYALSDKRIMFRNQWEEKYGIR